MDEAHFLLEAFLECPHWAQSYRPHLANASEQGEKVAVEVGKKRTSQAKRAAEAKVQS